MIEKQLSNLGLSGYEAEIFLVLLKNGPLSGYDIALKTGLYRQACYDTLNRLSEKGFASFVFQKGKKIFQAADPQRIGHFFDEQKREFEEVLPDLLRLSNKGKDDISVELFKGKGTDRIALRDIIATLRKIGGEVMCTAVDEKIPFGKDKLALEQYERDLARYKIKERVIIKKGAKGLFSTRNSRYRHIEEKLFNPNPIQIYGDKVQIFLWGNPNYLILIKNSTIADSFGKQFELMWKVAKR
jgi:biotin operon repressor